MASQSKELPAADQSVSAVDSFNSRTGAVIATSGDYTAAQVTNTPAGNIASTTVQTAVNELDTEKQAKAFTPTTAGNWSPAPTTVQDALDQLAARIKALEP